MLRSVRDWWFLRRVLRAVNRVRFKYGFAPLDRLPKGTPESPGGCPVAMSLSELDSNRETLFVPGDGFVLADVEEDDDGPGSHVEVPVPPIVDRFGSRFDAGDFPQLVTT